MPQLPLNAPTGTIKMVADLGHVYHEMAFVALSAFLNGLGPLFVDDIPCTFRLLSLVFLAYVPILIFWFQSDVVYTYRVDLIINLAIDHTIVWVHIVRPIVVEFVQSPSSTTNLNPAMHQGIARVLSTMSMCCDDKSVSVHSDEGQRGTRYFDILLDSIVDRILVETLPRLQRDPVGAGWYNFLVKYHTQDSLDQVLDDTIGRDQVPMQVTLLGYVLAELHVVLTFQVTEMMVAHASKRVVNCKIMRWIQAYHRSRFLSFGRLMSPFWPAWPPKSLLPTTATNACLLLVHFPVLNFSFNSDVVIEYCLDSFINVAIVHAFISIHILQSLLMVLQSMRRDFELKTLRGTAGVLNAYLQTTDGFDAFSMFAKSEFMVEFVFGWRAIMDYRTEAPGHPSAMDIYNQFIAPNSPYPLDNVMKGTILKRYAIAFESNSKYRVRPNHC
ncbi:hypothetical protein DYB28_007905 [Aphanomyces astaci]|uniref:RGS domain-containing protein n=2 Tax=Aphanomyces astaci TaxID=112090 RepID=A0A9X8DYF4_APHAT|nr:hypothetical protein DYB28_007905 [Aphanomyces astaci]